MDNKELRTQDSIKVFFIKAKRTTGDYCYINNKSNWYVFEPTVTLKHAKKFSSINQAKRFLKECAYSDRCVIVSGLKTYTIIEEEDI